MRPFLTIKFQISSSHTTKMTVKKLLLLVNYFVQISQFSSDLSWTDQNREYALCNWVNIKSILFVLGLVQRVYSLYQGQCREYTLCIRVRLECILFVLGLVQRVYSLYQGQIRVYTLCIRVRLECILFEIGLV